MSRIFQIVFLVLVMLIPEQFLLSQDTIYLSEPEQYTALLGSSTGSSVLALSQDLFLVAYNDGNSTGGTIKLGRVQEDSVIVFVDSVAFVPTPDPGQVSISKLSESRFILSFTLNERIYVRSGEVVDKALIMLGEIRKIESGPVSGFSQVTFAENLFITAYYDGASGMGTCALGSIGEDLEIDMDSTYLFTDSGISDTTIIALDTLSKSGFVISYGNAQGKSLLVSMDEDRVLSFGTPYTFASNPVHELNVVGLRAGLFVLVFDDENEGKRRGAVMLGTREESGMISYTEKFFFDNEKPSGISAIRLLPHEFMISYNGGWNDWHGYLIRARVVGGSVSFIDKVMFNPEPSLISLSPLARFDGQDFMVIYLNRNTYKGHARLGSTIEFGRLSSVAHFADPGFRIYPNPTSDVLYVQWLGSEGKTGDVSLKLIDMSGRTVLRKEFSPAQITSDRLTIDLGDLQEGIYLIQLSDGKNFATQKLIVK